MKVIVVAVASVVLMAAWWYSEPMHFCRGTLFLRHLQYGKDDVLLVSGVNQRFIYTIIVFKVLDLLSHFSCIHV